MQNSFPPPTSSIHEPLPQGLVAPGNPSPQSSSKPSLSHDEQLLRSGRRSARRERPCTRSRGTRGKVANPQQTIPTIHRQRRSLRNFHRQQTRVPGGIIFHNCTENRLFPYSPYSTHPGRPCTSSTTIFAEFLSHDMA